MLIQNVDTISPALSLCFFQQLIFEMQNEEPYTLAYVRTLHTFKGDSIPMIFAWTQTLFDRYFLEIDQQMISVEKILPVIDTLIACLEFDSNTLGKITDKNVFSNNRAASKYNDLLNGRLEWCSVKFVTLNIGLFWVFTKA